MRGYKSIRKFCFFFILFFGIICTQNTAYAKQTYSQGSFYYQIEDEAISITGYFGTKDKVTVPAMVAGYPVSKIATGAFDNADSVKELYLPDTIMEIEKGAIAEHISVSYYTESNNNTADTTVDEVLDNNIESNAQDSSIGIGNEDKGGKQETDNTQGTATLDEEDFEVEEIEDGNIENPQKFEEKSSKENDDGRNDFIKVAVLIVIFVCVLFGIVLMCMRRK